MLLRTPDFYDHFLCIGDSCKDCCCIGWELDIDDDTFEYYKSVPGPFGDRLRGCMSAARKVSPDAPGDDSLFGDDGGSTMYRLKIDGRCPFLNSKNLCEIVLNLGPQALCQICSEYPRYSFEFDGAVEKSLTISCEEAGRLMFLSDVPIGFVETEAGSAFWRIAGSISQTGSAIFSPSARKRNAHSIWRIPIPIFCESAFRSWSVCTPARSIRKSHRRRGMLRQKAPVPVWMRKKFSHSRRIRSFWMQCAAADSII